MRVIVGLVLVVGCSAGAADPPGTLVADVYFPGYGPNAIDLESGFVTSPGPATIDLTLDADGRFHAADAIAALGPGALGEVERIPAGGFDATAAPTAGSIYVVKTAEVAAMALEVVERIEQDGMFAGVRVKFAPLPSRKILLEPDGTVLRGRGAVTSMPAGLECESKVQRVSSAPQTCSDPFDPGDEVTLTATPIPVCREYAGLERPSIFAGWVGACAASTGATCTVPAGSDTVTAFPLFRAAGRVYITSNMPSAVSVTVDGAPCSGDCLLAVPEGSTVRVGVSPPLTASFAGGGGPTPGCNVDDERGCCMIALAGSPTCCTGGRNPGTLDATSCTFTASGTSQSVTIDAN